MTPLVLTECMLPLLPNKMRLLAFVVSSLFSACLCYKPVINVIFVVVICNMPGRVKKFGSGDFDVTPC